MLVIVMFINLSNLLIGAAYWMSGINDEYGLVDMDTSLVLFWGVFLKF